MHERVYADAGRYPRPRESTPSRGPTIKIDAAVGEELVGACRALLEVDPNGAIVDSWIDGERTGAFEALEDAVVDGAPLDPDTLDRWRLRALEYADDGGHEE